MIVNYPHTPEPVTSFTTCRLLVIFHQVSKQEQFYAALALFLYDSIPFGAHLFLILCYVVHVSFVIPLKWRGLTTSHIYALHLVGSHCWISIRKLSTYDFFYSCFSYVYRSYNQYMIHLNHFQLSNITLASNETGLCFIDCFNDWFKIEVNEKMRSY